MGLEKWTWREKKSRLIDNFVLAFCVAIRERKDGDVQIEQEDRHEDKIDKCRKKR
jgi:hypothetical protein